MNINKFINAQESLVNSYDLEQQNYINKIYMKYKWRPQIRNVH